MLKRRILSTLLTAAFALTLLSGCTSNSAESDYNEADTLLGEGYYNAALKAYQMILHDYPESPLAPPALYRTGYIYFHYLDDPKTAMEKYSELFYLYPEAKELTLAASDLAEIHSRAGEHLKAIAQYQWLLEEGSIDERALYQLNIAKEYILIYDLRQARIEFSELISAFPSSVYAKDASFQIATTYYLEGSYDEALSNYNKFLKNYPSDALATDAMLGKAASLEDSGRLEEALAVLSELQELSPGEDELIKVRIDGIKKRIDAPSRKKKRRRRKK